MHICSARITPADNNILRYHKAYIYKCIYLAACLPAYSRPAHNFTLQFSIQSDYIKTVHHSNAINGQTFLWCTALTLIMYKII